jgi:hypothetical protein
MGREYGDTFAFGEWKETTVLVLASRPIVLRSGFSQTYAVTHRNAVDWILIEPRLEPGMGPLILAELEKSNIKAILAWINVRDLPSEWETPRIRIWGLDDQLRDADP